MALTKPRASQIYDIDYKQATRVITTTDINLNGGAPSQVDGVNLSLDDRVLVIGQNTGSQNGIYFVDAVGTGSNGTWLRSTDTNSTGELLAGTIVMVTEGLVYHDTQWKLTTNNPIVIGTTALTFEQNSAFAFGNIYANNTAVLATSVGDVLTLTAGNNISITGNNASKTVSIGVTGISLNSISNGTSNVNVVSPDGNVTVSVAGTSNVAVFSSGGLDVTGNITGNGVGLSGINTFKTVAVTGGNSAVAANIADTLTLEAGSGIVLIANSASKTITVSTGGTGVSIFATGGDMELITDLITDSLDLGLVTEAVTENNDLGGFYIEGFVSNDNFLPGTIYGNILLANAVISTTGNITAGYFIGNGSQLTGVTASLAGDLDGNINGNGFGANTLSFVSASGNVTGGNLTTAGSVYIGSRAQLYDDGNFHIHSNASGDAIWINTNTAQLNLLAQATGGGSVGTGVGIGTSSLTGFVTIQGTKSWTTSSSYGYLVNSGTPTGQYNGGSQTISDVSLYANGRLMGIEIDALSDERAKNIQGNIPLDDALTFVKEIDGILYTWNRDAIEGNDTGLKSGFSAQRVHKAGFGHMISMMPNDRLAETTDEDGWTSPDKTQLAMNYSQAIPYHHEVIKHLLDRIEQLEDTVARLTADKDR